jgi:hypothetical protein
MPVADPILKHPWQEAGIGIIEIDTLEYQQTEKIETEMKDVDRIQIRKVYASCPEAVP